MQREAWAVLLLLLLAGCAIFTHATVTTEEYSRCNTGWNGTSALAAEEVRDLRDLPPGETLLILAPDRPFSLEEVGYLRTFLDSGGRVIIADEDGGANGLLADLGSGMRVRPENLASLERDHADPGLFTGYVVGNATIFSGVETVLVNRPAVVEGGEPLIETSILTWGDADGDGRISGDETFARRVVSAHEGNLTVLGDASLFVNAMLAENPMFIENLRPILVDAAHSRTGTANPIVNTILWIQERPPAAAAIAALAVLPAAYRFGRREND